MSLPDFSVTPHQAQKTRCITTAQETYCRTTRPLATGGRSVSIAMASARRSSKARNGTGWAFQTCVNAGVVCRRFETNSRELTVSFRNHQAIAPIDDDGWRQEVLAWAAKEQPKRAVIEQRVKEVRAYLSQGWTPDQADRRARDERGECRRQNRSVQTSGQSKRNRAPRVVDQLGKAAGVSPATMRSGAAKISRWAKPLQALPPKKLRRKKIAPTSSHFIKPCLRFRSRYIPGWRKG